MFLGKRNSLSSSVPASGGLSTMGLSAHWWVTIDAGMVTWRRHLPSCMTTGKSVPHGTLLRMKCPLESVNAVAMGWPDTWASQEVQLAPAGIGSSAAFGMATMTLESGFSPAGSYTVPLILVVAPPSQWTWLWHRLTQVPQTFAMVAPQVMPAGQVAGQLSVPPQPSPMLPQYCCGPLASLQVTCTQLGPPMHTLLLPHAQPLPAAEQSVLHTNELPQPSPMVPQYWPPEAGVQVTGTQVEPPLHRLFWQVQPALVHVVPQSSELPQPSPMVPQYWAPLPVVQVSGVQTPGGPIHR